jgi:hypothetical protein
LEIFYDLVYKHGLVLSPVKMEIGKTTVEFLGLITSEEKINIQDHVLKNLLKFPNTIMDKT